VKPFLIRLLFDINFKVLNSIEEWLQLMLNLITEKTISFGK